MPVSKQAKNGTRRAKIVDTVVADKTTQPAGFSAAGWGVVGDYMVDAAQRTVLFADLLRRRSAQYAAHKAEPLPNVLSFEAELVLDARNFDKPVNYLLVRVLPPAGVTVNAQKRPFIVIDPRAGHGPGIGGFKADSELGVALKAGHPCYFVGFAPRPMPGQTIEDILHAEAVFVEKVIALHPDADGKPCIIGNCQAGWAVMMLAATRPELCGPLIVAGAPLSYWAGVEGKNPMRYSGGLLGGSWLTALSSDLGHGVFDGGHLVSNFENLNPANTLWSKQYDVWANIDQGAERYLEFEKWWSGHVDLNAEEIQWIVDNLFVGNRLATAELVTAAGERIDLRSIRSPIVCFCSKGDNITPPQQALGWIVDLYAHDADILACAQTIVYAVHDKVGHLGIFVSGGVAKKEHQEFATNIDLIDALPPGLYEAVMTPKTAQTVNSDLVVGDWVVRFERRTLQDVRNIVQPSLDNERRFATVARVSEINLGLYRTFLAPFVKALATDQFASLSRQFNPAQLPLTLFSAQNPLMPTVEKLADAVRQQRHPAAPDNPLLAWQTALSDAIVQALDGWRDVRDATLEQLFLTTYGAPLLQAWVGLRADDHSPRRRPGQEPERVDFVRARIRALRERIADGGPIEAGMRSLCYVGMANSFVDERVFNQLAQMRGQYGELALSEFKRIVREQYFSLLLDEEAALAALPAMLPKEAGAKRKLFDNICLAIEAAGDLRPEQRERLARIQALFDIRESKPTHGPSRAPSKTRSRAGQRKR